MTKKHQRTRLRQSNTAVLERDYSAAERTAMAKTGEAMPDGKFPIKTVADLHNAIRLHGSTENPAEAKQHIITRATAMDAHRDLPYGWVPTHESGINTPIETHQWESGSGIAVHESIDVLESTVIDAANHIIEVTLIKAGLSKMGNFYPPETLSNSVALFEGAPAFADHQKRPDLPEGSVKDIVGYYKNVKAITGSSGTSLRGQLHLLPNAEWLYNLLEATQDNPRLCGVSIDAWADRDDARSTRESQYINRLIKVNSADIVTRASAGGAIRRVMQSDVNNAPFTPYPTKENQVNYKRDAAGNLILDAAGQPIILQESENKSGAGTTTDPAPTAHGSTTDPSGSPTTTGVAESSAHASTATGTSGAAPSGVDLASIVNQLQQERTAANRELNSLREALAPNGNRQSNPGDDLAQLAAELRRDRDVTRSDSVLTQKLQEAALPLPVANKLRRLFAGHVFETAVLESTIRDEKDVLAQLSASGDIRGMGYEKQITVGMNEYEQLQAAFDAMFDIYESDAAKTVPRLSGLREAFAAATGRDIGSLGGADYKLRESIGQGLQNYVRAGLASGRLTESEALLREADVTTASFSALLGTSMNKRLLKDYQAWPSEWQKFASIVAIKDFKAQTRVRLGAFGSLSTVAEDAAYTTLTVADTSATYTPTKRGNLVQVTRETIINDDLYAIKQIPQKLAAAAAFTLAEFVYNLLAPNFGNIYDAHPLFDSINHLNTGVIAANLNTTNSGVALSSVSLQAAIIAMRKQKNLAAKPIGLKPRYILVPPDLEFAAMTLLRSAGLPGGNNNDINPILKGVRWHSLMFAFPSK